MANFAYVINGQIDSVYDLLPRNWQSTSNFYVLENDEERLNSFNWYKITKIIPEYDSSTHRLGEVRRWIDNGIVYETEDLIELPPQLVIEIPEEELICKQWDSIREQRDRLIAEFDWRILRYQREVRVGLMPSDNIEMMDTYIQSLADLPEIQTDPFNIVWPVYGENI